MAQLSATSHGITTMNGGIKDRKWMLLLLLRRGLCSQQIHMDERGSLLLLTWNQNKESLHLVIILLCCSYSKRCRRWKVMKQFETLVILIHQEGGGIHDSFDWFIISTI